MSRVFLVKSSSLGYSDILESLLMVPKGKDKIFFVDNSQELPTVACNKKRIAIQQMVKRMALPYGIYFFVGHSGLCGFWKDLGGDTSSKEWFDSNAEQGVYPVVNKRRIIYV